jgi:hypothetical protein
VLGARDGLSSKRPFKPPGKDASPMKLKLRFPRSTISKWAARYSYPSDADIENVVAPAARRQGFLTREQFLAIAEWKTVRSRSRCRRNDDGFVREVTRAALSSKNERFKIEVLRLLDGIDWPTASVILHFCDRGRYPILDVRALWSLGVAVPPPVGFHFWMEYTEFLRGVASDAGVSMRTLDRALWQYSKVNQ